MHLTPHEKFQILNIAIAIVSGSLAAWLAVTARVKAAIALTAHARAQMRTNNARLKEAQQEIVALRRRIAKLIAENEALSGRGASKEAQEEAEWESAQRMLEEAAQRVKTNTLAVTTGNSDRKIAQAAIAEAVKESAVKQPSDSPFHRFIFRRKAADTGETYARDNTRDIRDR